MSQRRHHRIPAPILAKATAVFGSQDLADKWLREPALGLENNKPIDLLTSSAGIQAVETFLTRLEHGVYV